MQRKNKRVPKENSKAAYVNKRGMGSRVTTFRCSDIMRERLFEYAAFIRKDPSYVIRAALAEYLRSRITVHGVFISKKLNGWSAKTTKK